MSSYFGKALFHFSAYNTSKRKKERTKKPSQDSVGKARKDDQLTPRGKAVPW